MSDGVPAPPGTDERTHELAQRLAALEQRIATACRHARRPREDVCMIAVTKTWPAGDVHRLAGLGVREVAENRDQEAAPKVGEVAALSGAAGAGLRWHFVGQLQTNKVRSVAGYAEVVHTVDRQRLVTALSRAAQEQEREVGCLVQIRLDDDPRRGGTAPEELAVLAEAVAVAAGLRLIGVMGVAPLGADPAASFALLAASHEQLCRDHPGARWLSMGMSADLEAAVDHGATHLRIGTALLGSRPPLR